MDKEYSSIVFGGGCFWCTEAVFRNLRGVISVMPGYAGGLMVNPTYEQVCAGDTGHAEVIKIEYDPTQIRYEDLLIVFFATHDATTVNRQGNDVGSQYRSIILYSNEQQKCEAETFIEKLNEQPGEKSIVTEVKSLDQFYEAEKYHQNYFERNSDQPYCQIMINPKLEKVKAKFHQLLKQNTL